MAGGKRANGGVLGEMSIVILAAAVTLCSVAMANAVTVCNVRAYGAKADGRTMNTSAIQTAIDVCAKKGGGRVRLDGGTFLSGPIVLKSNINLDIRKVAHSVLVIHLQICLGSKIILHMVYDRETC